MNTRPGVKIEHREIEGNRRALVTSDIHGPLAYFEKLLEKADFSDEDILIMVGDLIEKRPESLKKPCGM